MSTELQAALRAVEEAVYAENERGGEARAVVRQAAALLGVDLGHNRVGDVWDPANMARVPKALVELIAAHTELTEKYARLERVVTNRIICHLEEHH